MRTPIEEVADTIERQALHARELCFRHPRTGEEMAFTAELPEDMAWVIEVARGGTAAD